MLRPCSVRSVGMPSLACNCDVLGHYTMNVGINLISQNHKQQTLIKSITSNCAINCVFCLFFHFDAIPDDGLPGYQRAGDLEMTLAKSAKGRKEGEKVNMDAQDVQDEKRPRALGIAANGAKREEKLNMDGQDGQDERRRGHEPASKIQHPASRN